MQSLKRPTSHGTDSSWNKGVAGLPKKGGPALFIKRGATMTISNVARLAGVSITTVSRVINRHRKVKEEVRVRVLEIIEKCGYKPDPYAQYLGRRRNGKT